VDPAAEPAADDSSGGPAGQLALLKAYAKHPHPHAVVALFGRGLLKSFDALAGQAAVVACEMTFDAVHEVEAAFSVRFDRQAAELLRQTVGADVTRLRAEAEKIALYATGRATITRELVSEVMNRASATDNLWKLVANRRLADALRELQLELAEGAKPGIHFMILGLLRSVVERTVAPRDLPGAFDALLRTDLALKTSGGDPRVLLERLIVELCATGRD
jgi:DNA polymerase III delta subunit